MKLDVFEKALVYAMQKHHGMRRKAEDIPYLLHPMEVAVIAASMTNDPDILAACLLHDTVEDTDTSLEEIKTLFGPRIHAYVACETENKRHDEPANMTWMIRKEESLAKLRNTDDINVKIIWLADKLANIRAFYRSYQKDGDAMWKMFNQSDPAKQAWYYGQVRLLTEDLKDHAAWQEYSKYLTILFQGGEDETD